jgi:hypothetical protein
MRGIVACWLLVVQRGGEIDCFLLLGVTIAGEVIQSNVCNTMCKGYNTSPSADVSSCLFDYILWRDFIYPFDIYHFVPSRVPRRRNSPLSNRIPAKAIFLDDNSQRQRVCTPIILHVSNASRFHRLYWTPFIVRLAR